MISRNLARRLAFSVVAIPATLAVGYLGGWALAAYLALIAALGANELYGLARAAGVEPLGGLGIAAAVGAPLAAYWTSGEEAPGAEPTLYLAVVWLLALLTTALWRRSPTRRPLAAVGVTVFGAIYAGALPSFAIAIRHPGGVGTLSWAGASLLFFPLVLTWVGDTAAYAGGTAVGGARLAPILSPNKTWAGAVSGLAATLLAAAAYALWVLPDRWRMSVPEALAAGLVIGVAALLGDLAESLLKREVGVKDSSAILPGHGGVLDRLDSLYFVLPVTAALFHLLGIA